MSTIKMFKPYNGKVHKLTFDIEDFIYFNQLGIKLFTPHSKVPHYLLAYIGQIVNTVHKVLINCPAGMVIDHANRDSLDNRRVNLRICSKSQNYGNRRAQLNRISAFKGVSKYSDSRPRPWRCRLIYKNKLIRYKAFASEIEAALQYNIWAKELLGEFAVLNVIKEDENGGPSSSNKS